ncbi:MAG: M48 family metallopeptidase [Pirellulaceae bacterium]|nr:M48 family metallopeptidase [Pirellulaceae bacterium]
MIDRRTWLTVTGAWTVGGCCGCRSAPITGRKQMIMFPEQTEIAMGQQAFAEVMQQSQELSTSLSSQLVHEVGHRVAAASGRTDYEWEVRLIRGDEQNAYCLPGGKIVVYEGILPVCQNEAGLAVVMSHEVAHVLARHGGERMSQQAAVNGAQQVLGVLTQNREQVSRELWMRAYGVATNYGVLLPYSRKHETEADHIGLMLMSQAGYDPSEAPRFWQRFGSASQGAVKPPEFMSTHPADHRRASELEKLLPEALTIYRQAVNPIGVGRTIV